MTTADDQRPDSQFLGDFTERMTGLGHPTWDEHRFSARNGAQGQGPRCFDPQLAWVPEAKRAPSSIDKNHSTGGVLGVAAGTEGERWDWQVIHIDPGTGAESVAATLPVVPGLGSTGLVQGQAVFFDGSLYLLEPSFKKDGYLGYTFIVRVTLIDRSRSNERPGRVSLERTSEPARAAGLCRDGLLSPPRLAPATRRDRRRS